jgi:hypothetical protein
MKQTASARKGLAVFFMETRVFAAEIFSQTLSFLRII